MARSLVVLAALSLALVPACTCGGASGGKAGPPEPAVVAALAPVAAPDGLLADVTLATPNATWQRLQRAVGGTLGLLPSTLGGLVCAYAGLDPNLGPEIDGSAALTGAVADDPKDVAWAVAMKVIEPRRVRDMLFEGETARYAPRALGDMTLLVPRGGGAAGGAAGPVAALGGGGYLVLARSLDDLTRLGPYAFRTVPTKPPPAIGALVFDLPRTSLAGPLRTRAASLWESARADLAKKDDAARAAHGGRAPDYGDPRAVLALLDGALQSRLATLADLEHAHAVLDVTDGGVRAELVVTPAAGDGPARAALAAMRPGDPAPLLDVEDTPLAVLVRDDEPGRAQTAADIEDAVTKALGERLAEPEARRLHAALGGFAKARGDWTTFGLVGVDGLFLRSPAASPDAADRALRDFVALAGVAPLKQGLRIQDVTVGAGTARVAYGAPEAKGGAPSGGAAKQASLRWSTTAGELAVTLGPPSTPPSAARKLGDDPQLALALRALERSVTFAAVVQPLKLDPVRALSPAAPVVLAWGRRDAAAYLRVEASVGLAREVLRMRTGL